MQKNIHEANETLEAERKKAWDKKMEEISKGTKFEKNAKLVKTIHFIDLKKRNISGMVNALTKCIENLHDIIDLCWGNLYQNCNVDPKILPRLALNVFCENYKIDYDKDQLIGKAKYYWEMIIDEMLSGSFPYYLQIKELPSEANEEEVRAIFQEYEDKIKKCSVSPKESNP